jgi:ATP dependent DNA ligase domain
MFLPCLPTPKKRAPTGAAWVHEIKHDGYRLMVRRDGNRVRLYTRRGYHWSHRFPLIVQAVTRLKVRSVIIDGFAHTRFDQSVLALGCISCQPYERHSGGFVPRGGHFIGLVRDPEGRRTGEPDR